MKNLSLILNVILLLAVGFLYFLKFGKAEEVKKEEVESGYDIAYVHADSLVKRYQFVIDQNNKLKKRTEEIQQDYQNRANGLQREIQNYQRNLSNLTIAQAKKIEEDLGKKDQQLRLFQEQARQEVSGMETNVSAELYETIGDFLTRYALKNDLKLVVKYDYMSDILYASKPLDITDVVINELNKEYISKYKSEVMKPDSTVTK